MKKYKIPKLGAKVRVPDEKRPFVVKARNNRFAVCTKPHFHTVRYFVLDLKQRIRGTENLVFGMGAETTEQCEEMLERVTKGETEVSSRNFVPWDIEVVP